MKFVASGDITDYGRVRFQRAQEELRRHDEGC